MLFWTPLTFIIWRKHCFVFCRWQNIINAPSFDCQQHSDVCTAGRVLFTIRHVLIRSTCCHPWDANRMSSDPPVTEHLLITIQCNDYTMVKPYDITNALWYWQLYASDDDGKRNTHWKYRDNTGCFTLLLNAVQIYRELIKTSELINTWS